jgi:curved DNA-binding protein CbpA
MANPYTVLGLPIEADDAAIRSRYLQLTREFTPEEFPEKSAAIRKAYDQIKNLERRVKYRIFESGADESIDAILEELSCTMPRKRVTLNELFRAAGISGR